MKLLLRNSLFFYRFLLIITTALVVAGGQLAGAREDWEAFLRALTAQRYYDVAVDYLESFRNDPKADATLRAELDYRAGMMTFDWAKITQGATRSGLLVRSEKYFNDFLRNHSDSPLAPDCYGALAQLGIEKGKGLVAEAQKLADSEKATRLVDARLAFEKAGESLTKSLETAREKAKEFQEDSPQSTGGGELYSAFLSLLIQDAALGIEQSQTWEKNSENYRVALIASREKLRGIFGKYRNYAGAWNARFLEAKIDHDLGEYVAAKEILNEIFALTSNPAFYGLKTQALLLLGETELAVAPHDCESMIRFIERFDQWKTGTALPEHYYRSFEGLRLHLIASRVLIELGQLQQKNRSDYNKNLKNVIPLVDSPIYKLLQSPTRMNVYAQEQSLFVQNCPGAATLAEQATEILANPALATRPTGETASLSFTNFEDAVAAVNKFWHSTARNLSNDTTTTPEQWDEGDLLFRSAFRLAPLADAEQKAEVLPQLQLDRASFCFLARRYDESFILAQSLCKTQADQAPKGAKMAIASIKRLQQEEKKLGNSLRPELDETLLALADYTNTRWGNDTQQQSLVQDALLVLMESAIAQNSAGNNDRVVQLLDQFPAKSPQRAIAEIQLGLSLWGNYDASLKAMTAGNSQEGNIGDSNEKRKATLTQAIHYLQTGLTDRLSNQAVESDDYFSIYAALVLAQAYLADNQPAESLKWLNHPTIGPLGAAQTNLTATDSGAATSGTPNSINENFRLAVFSLTLRVYVGMNDFAQAQALMDQLDKAMPGASDRTLAIYLYLGRELEQQLRELRLTADSGDAQKREQLKTVSAGFEQLLEKIAAGSEQGTYSTLRWIVDTYCSLARGISGEMNETPQSAVDYYTKAGRICQKIIKKILNDPLWTNDPNARWTTSIRLIETLRSTGRYENALRVATELLQEKETSLDLQVEAAKIYQDWGRLDKDYYIKAILGGEPKRNGQNLIWGWNQIIFKLAKVINTDQKYSDLFFNAYLDKMNCRYHYLRRLTDTAEMKKQASQSEAEIARLAQTYPNLGGPAFRRKFEDQLKRFQRQQEE